MDHYPSQEPVLWLSLSEQLTWPLTLSPETVSDEFATLVHPDHSASFVLLLSSGSNPYRWFYGPIFVATDQPIHGIKAELTTY